MRAAILSIGDELILGQAVDTNSAWLADRLAMRSIRTDEHRTVGDDLQRMTDAITALTACHDLLVITGGLGPTEDDLTREALGALLTPGQPLEMDEDILSHLERRYARRGVVMPASNRVQARRPAAMRFLANPVGTAPGLVGRHGGCLIFALPGPPREVQPMFERHVLAELPQPEGAAVLRTVAVHEYGLGEAAAAELLGDLTRRDRGTLVGTTAAQSIVTARIRVYDEPEPAQREVEETAALIERLWRPYCFGRDETTLPEAVGALLRSAGRTLATAESCTGGWLGKMIVDVSGSSDYYLGGWVTYSDGMKTSCLGVPQALIAEHGAVSERVAAAMARGAQQRAGADFALAITGIAGPEGGTDAKPVGTVFIALAAGNAGGERTQVRRFEFAPGRFAVRDRSAKSALQMLRFALMEVDDDRPLLWQVPLHDPAEVRSTEPS